MRTLVKTILSVAVVGGFLAGSSSAEAAFKVRLTAGGDTVTVEDNQSGDASNVLGEIVVAAITVGDYRVTVVGALSKPFTGSAALPDMDLAFQVTTLRDTTQTLSIFSTDTGYITSPIPINTSIGGTMESQTTVLARTFFDNANAEFGQTGGPATIGPFTSTPFAGSAVLSVTGAQPYSLTQRIDVTSLLGGQTTSGDFQLTAVPVPGGLIMALTGIPVLGLGAWYSRRRARRVA